MFLPAATGLSVRNGVLGHFLVYGAELCPKFLETRPVFGIVLPAVVHDPRNLQRAGAWCSHTVSWKATQPIKTRQPGPSGTSTRLRKQRVQGTAPACRSDLYLSPPRLSPAGCSCSCTVSGPGKKSPTTKYQSSTRHSRWCSNLEAPAGGSIDKGTGEA